MGGPGSGRLWRFGACETVNDYRVLDVRRWQRDGLLEPGHCFAWQWERDDQVVAFIHVITEPSQVVLAYRHRRQGEKDWKSEEYPVRLEWTKCHFGGRRRWFLCPNRGCGRRVALLYGGGIFACRRCHQLAYPSQRESGLDRSVRRAEKIRERLGWQAGILNERGEKPKGMHWSTFRKLTKE